MRLDNLLDGGSWIELLASRHRDGNAGGDRDSRERMCDFNVCYVSQPREVGRVLGLGPLFEPIRM